MTAKIKKFTSIFFALILIWCIRSADLVAFANELNEKNNINVAVLNESGNINASNKNANNLDLILCNEIDEETADSLREYIDNGTDVFIETQDISDCANAFNCNYADFDDDSTLVGCYLKTVGGNYSLTPITISIIDDSGTVIDVPESDLSKMRKDIKSNNLYQDLKTNQDDLEFVNEISDKELSNLQTSTAIGNSFMDVSVFEYFYKKGSAGGTGTTYTYNSRESVSGYSKLGSIKILGYAIKLKTVGTTTYDNIYSKVTASGLNDKFVKYYTYNMEVYSRSAEIIDESYLEGNINATVSTSIANTISSNGSSVTNSTTYTYNPNGQSINNQLGKARIKTWKASNSAKKRNGSWTIPPSITVKRSDGTRQYTTIGIYVNDFQVGGGTRTYTIKSRCGVTFSIKNHK